MTWKKLVSPVSQANPSHISSPFIILYSLIFLEKRERDVSINPGDTRQV
jgi:hypothetical protein